MEEFVSLENRPELNKRKATFRDRFKHYVNEDDAIQEQKIIDQIKNDRLAREEALVSGGAVLPLDVRQDGTVNDNREAEIDDLVAEYNSNPNNTRKLKTSEEIENDAISLIKPDSNIDFEGGFFSNAFAGISAYVYKHPVEILASAAGFVFMPQLLAFAGVTAAVAGLVSEAAVIGAFEIKKALNKKKTADILSEKGKQQAGLEDVNVVQEAAVKTAEAMILGKAIAKFAGIASSAGKKVFPFVSRTAKQTEPILSKVTGEVSAKEAGQVSSETVLKNLAENATPEETAAFVDAIKRAGPSSVTSIENRINLEADLLDYFEASMSGDVDKISEILQKESSPIISKEISDLTIEGMSERAGIDLSYDMASEISDFYKATNEEFAKISNRGIADNISDIAKEPDFLSSKTAEYFKDRFPVSYAKNNNNLKMFNELKDSMSNLAKNGVEVKLGGFELEDLRVLHKPSQRQAALEFNKSLRKAELTEMLMAPINARKVVTKDTVSAAVGNYLEFIENDTVSTIFPKFQDLAESIWVATKEQSEKLDVAEFFDVVTGKSSSSRMLGVKNAWDESINNIKRSATKAGLDFSPDVPYFPNKWSPKKIIGKREEFITDMLNSVDKEAMKKLTSKEVNEEFFGKMHDGLINNDPGKSSRVIVMKDGASWKSMHEKYGSISTVDEVVSTAHVSAKNQITSTLRDLNNTSYIREQLNTIKNIAFEKNSSERFIEILQKESKKLEKIMGNELGDPTDLIPPYFKGFIHAVTYPKVSLASVSAYCSDRLGTMPNAFAGIGVKDPIMTSLRGTLSNASKKELETIYNISRNFSRDVSAISKDAMLFSPVRDRAIKYGKFAYNAPRKATSAITSVDEKFSNYIFGTSVVENFHLPFSKLDEGTKKFLIESGFSEIHWDILRSMEPVSLDGTSILSSNIINKRLEEGLFNSAEITLIKDVRNKLAYAETAYSLLAVPRSTAIGRAAVIRADTAAGQALTALKLPFNNITYSMWLYAFKESGQRFGYAPVSFRVLFSAVVATFVVDGLRGKISNVSDPSFWYKVATRSSKFGLWDDALAEMIGLRYESDIESFSKGAKDIAKGKKAKGFKTIFNKFNPFSNFTLLGTLATSYTTDMFFNMMDPEGAAVYDRELKNALNKGKINELIYEARRPKNRLPELRKPKSRRQKPRRKSR